MDHDEIVALTHEYGGQWAIGHADRLIATVSAVSDGALYDTETIWLAAHLHDWGGYAKWIVPGTDHAARSVEVVGEFLAARACPAALAAAVLECIEYHHGGPTGRSIESNLFTDADALDLLGAVGFARVFAMNHRDLRKGVASLRRHRDASEKAITLASSRRIAEPRMQELDRLLESFEQETGGVY